MSMRYKGSRLSATANTPTSLTASGAWTLQQQMQANGTSTWPFVRDPQFNYVTMLLHGDGSAGANNGSGGGVTPTVTAFDTDASTNNFNLTINGDARSNNFTPYQGNGYYSNYFGSGNRLALPNNSCNVGANNFTLEAWVKPDSFSTYSSIFNSQTNASTASGSSYGMAINQTTGTLQSYWYVGSTTYDISSSGAVPLNQWSHVALARTGGTISLFLNGTKVATNTSMSTNTINDGATTYPPAIGYNGNGFAFLGFISNFRLLVGSGGYDATASTITVPTAPLTAVTNTVLLSCQSNRFIDNSASPLTITPTGSPQVAPAQPFTLPSSVATYGSGYFDGTGDSLNTPSTGQFAPTGNFTISCWYYPTSTRTYQQVLGNYSGSGSTDWIIEVTSGTGVNFYTNGSTVRISGSGVVLNAWNYLVMARSGSTITGYVNGVSVGTYSQSGTFGTSTQPISIARGGAVTASGDYALGYITDVKLIDGSAVTTVPTAPQTATTGTSLLTTQFNGGGNNSGFKDSSQNNFVITRNGNTTQGTFAPYGSNWSNYFDGTGDYLSTNSSSVLAFGSNDFTVEAWVYFTSINSTTLQIIFMSGSLGGNNIYCHVDADQISVGTTVAFISNQPSSFSAGVWYHIAFCRSGGTLRLFKDGVQQGSSVTDSTSWISSGFAAIGANQSATQTVFGYISNLRVLNGTGLYTSNFTPSTVPLTAITNTSLLTCADNRFIDDSTNNLTITKNGDTSVQRFSPFANATAYNPATTGGSGYFGSANYLSAASNVAFGFGTGDFTVEAWVYPNAAYTTYNYIWATGVNDGLVVYVSSGVLYARAYNVIDLLASSVAPALNAWSHVAVTRSGTTLRIFVNGVQTGTTTNSTNFATGSGLVGNDGTNAAPWYGYISDLRVVKGTALYTGNFTPPTAPLTPTANTSLLLSNTNSAILDQSMMNDLQTVGNAQISTSVVKYGTASMYFDGSGDYLRPNSQLPFVFNTGDFTIEFWVYANSVSGWSTFFDNRPSTTGSGFFFGYNSGFQYYSGSSNLISGGTLSTSTWTHVALCRSSGSVRIFVNGTQVGSTATDTSNYNASTVLANGPFIGSNYVPSDFLNGYLDDFRVTKYARYTTTFTPPTQALPNG